MNKCNSPHYALVTLLIPRTGHLKKGNHYASLVAGAAKAIIREFESTVLRPHFSTYRSVLETVVLTPC